MIDLAHSTETARTNRFPWQTGVLLLIGFGLVYWGHRQLLDIQEITGSEFRIPTGRMLLWLGTMILSGIVFGLALAATRDQGRSKTLALLWGVIPLAILVYYTLTITGALVWRTPLQLATFLFADVTIDTSALLVGLFVAAALAPWLLPSGRRH